MDGRAGGRADGRTGGRADGRVGCGGTDERTDGRVDGQADGRGAEGLTGLNIHEDNCQSDGQRHQGTHR